MPEVWQRGERNITLALQTLETMPLRERHGHTTETNIGAQERYRVRDRRRSHFVPHLFRQRLSWVEFEDMAYQETTERAHSEMKKSQTYREIESPQRCFS